MQIPPPTARDLEYFRVQLEQILQPFFAITDENLRVEIVDCKSKAWTFFDITSSMHESLDNNYLDDLIAKIADDSSASKIVIEKGNSKIRLGIVSKYRYLTSTRARICGLDLIQNHSEAFPINKL